MLPMSHGRELPIFMKSNSTLIAMLMSQGARIGRSKREQWVLAYPSLFCPISASNFFLMSYLPMYLPCPIRKKRQIDKYKRTKLSSHSNEIYWTDHSLTHTHRDR